MPIEALALSGLAAVPVVQRAFGLITFAADAWLAAMYVFGLAAVVTVGARAQQLRPWAMPNALFALFGIAAVASVLLMLAQWLQWDGLGTLLMSLPPGSRLSGNLGQPNQMATLLVWGLLALWWAHLRGHLQGRLLWLLGALLLAGVAMTQSRAGMLQLLLLAGAAVWFRQPLRAREYAVALGALGVWFVLVALAWAPLNEALRPGHVATLQERLAPGTRLLHWRLLLDAVAAQPWFGWGWNQIVHAQGQLAPLHPASHEVLEYGHNILLDLVLWNGAPIGILAGLAILAWGIRQFRLACSAERVLVLLVVAVFFVHAMVELPHGYLLFLLPVGLMAGALHVPMDRCRDWTVSRQVVAVPFAALALGTFVVVSDYGRVEDAWMAHRFRTARIGSLEEPPLPQTVVLTNLQALLEFMRTEPRAGMSAEELTLLRQVSQRYPSGGGLFRYAWALALNGKADEAQRTLVLLCRIHPQAECLAAKQAWLLKSEQGPKELAAVWPAVP